MASRFALLLASSEYADTTLRRLRAPAADVAAFAQVLDAPEIGAFEVTSILNEPSHMLRRAIDEFFSDRERDDLLLLYFTGHGVKDDAGQLFFATPDTSRRLLNSTAVSAAFVSEAMRRARCRRILLVLDCCYSGAFSRDVKGDDRVGVTERFDGRGRLTLTSSDTMEYSFEGDEIHGRGARSVFTRVLVDGLGSGAADLDGDGRITVDELYDYLYERIRGIAPNQTPGLSGQLQGQFVIATSPSRTEPEQRPVDDAREQRSHATIGRPSPRALRRWRWPVIAAIAGLFALVGGGLAALLLARDHASTSEWEPVSYHLYQPGQAVDRPTDLPWSVTPTSRYPTGLWTRIDPTVQATSLTFESSLSGGSFEITGGKTPDGRFLYVLSKPRPFAGGRQTVRLDGRDAGQPSRTYVVLIVQPPAREGAITSLTVRGTPA